MYTEKDKVQETLVNRICHGDPVAFDELYNIYFTYLSVYATSILHNPDDSIEVVNDVFLHLWEKRESLQWPIRPYLVRSTRNGALNKLREKNIRAGVEEGYKHEILDFQIQAENNTDLLEFREFNSLLMEYADTLPEQCRKIFKFHFLHNLSVKEISERMEINPSTVRVQIKIALDKIRLHFSQK